VSSAESEWGDELYLRSSMKAESSKSVG